MVEPVNDNPEIEEKEVSWSGGARSHGRPTPTLSRGPRRGGSGAGCSVKTVSAFLMKEGISSFVRKLGKLSSGSASVKKRLFFVDGGSAT